MAQLYSTVVHIKKLKESYAEGIIVHIQKTHLVKPVCFCFLFKAFPSLLKHYLDSTQSYIMTALFQEKAVGQGGAEYCLLH